MNLLRRIRGAIVPTVGTGGLVAAAPPVPLREIFRRFWPYTRAYRRWLWLSLAFIVLVPAIDTVTLWLFKVVVDDVLIPRDLGPLPWIGGAYVGLSLLGGAIAFTDRYLSDWVAERFLLDLRTGIFRHLHGLSMDFFERRRLGDVLSRLSGDVNAIEDLVLSGVADAISYVVRILFFAGALFFLAWQLALASLLVAPLGWLVATRFSRWTKQASREKRRRSGSIVAVAEESLANVPLVQAYNRQDHEVERFHRENLGAFRAQMASTRIKALYGPVIDVIELAGGLTVIGLGTWLLSRGELTTGGLLVFIAFLAQLYGPIRSLGGLSNRIFSASAGAERLIELLDEQPAVRDPARPRALGAVRGRVALDNVSFTYPGAARPALDGVSLVVEPGETLALVGPSGAGKTTVARLLLRFHDPAAGAVSLDGCDVREIALHDVRDQVAVLLQETLVFEGSVGENIAYGRPGATEEEIGAAARAADAHEFVIALPQGYDTLIGEKGRRLSGGQKQRIAIARAMVRAAPVLVLDEPTTGLDAESGRRVLEPLRRLMAGRTTILISHNLLAVSEADRIAYLERGRVAESGTHDELLRLGGGYARLWRLHEAARPAPAAA